MKTETFRLYKLVKANGFKSTFAANQAKLWVKGLNDTKNIISYHQKPSIKSNLIGNS